MNIEIFITKEIINKISKIFNIRNEDLIERYKINFKNYLPLATIKKIDKTLKIPKLSKIHNKKKINHCLHSKITLRSNQLFIFNKFIDIIIKNKNEIVYILFIAPCGFGKTFVSLSLLEQIVYNKTIIITHSINMAEQWTKNIKDIYDDIDVFTSDRGVSTFNYNNKNIDILCFPFMHLKNIKFVEYITQNFSLCIIDEIHKYNLLNNNIISNFLNKYIFPISIFITATPRNDTMMYINEVIDANELYETTYEKQYYIISSNKKIPEFEYFKEFKKLSKIKNDPIMTDLYIKLCLSVDYNRFDLICKTIIAEYKSFKDAKILLLTKFNNEIESYVKHLSDFNIFYVKASETTLDNKLKEIEEKKINKYILIGTGDNIGTGSDTKNFTSLHFSVLYTNINFIKQSIGRISRENISNVRKIFIYNIKPHKNIKIEKYISTMINVLDELGWRNYIECEIKPNIFESYEETINSNIYKNYNDLNKFIIKLLKDDNFFDIEYINSNFCLHNI